MNNEALEPGILEVRTPSIYVFTADACSADGVSTIHTTLLSVHPPKEITPLFSSD